MTEPGKPELTSEPVVVALGASAGGLAALASFFLNLPKDELPGMAFVVVQHLAPDHTTSLPELIRGYTRLPVTTIEDGMPVLADQVYVLPPNHDLALLRGTFQLLELSAPIARRLPIDFFFRSLAQDRGFRSVGIVLSGTGTDGSLGIRDIKGAGGLAMAQRPDTTQFDGMPRAAISTGLVDFVLPAEEMPAKLCAYTSHRVAGNRPGDEDADDPRAMEKLFVIVRARTGHDFSAYKRNTTQRRVRRRMAVNQIDSHQTYVSFARQNPGEVDLLFKDLLIGVTSFFRDAGTFSLLGESVVPELFSGKQAGDSLRVWVPACSTGEEAYSIAMLLSEWQEQAQTAVQLQIFATDIDPDAIATARRGLFPASIAADLSAERLARFFTPEVSPRLQSPLAYQVHKHVRDLLVFSEQDVAQDPPFSRLDFISCRNLLIYLNSELQSHLIPLFHYALNPGGYLLLGTSESIGEHSDLFETVDRRSKIYRRAAGHSTMPQKPTPGSMRPSYRGTQRPRTPTGPSSTLRPPSSQQITENALLRELPLAAVLVDPRGGILYIHGRTGTFLEPAQGTASNSNILAMSREGLRHPLTNGLRQCETSGKPVQLRDLRVKTNGERTLVDAAIYPVAANPDADTSLFLVTMQAKDAVPGALDESSPDTAGNDIGARVTILEQELAAKEEYLRATTEELGTANEELRSANEEMQSINEEMQSTNEELETSKEELQSVNEELSTVNAELEAKVLELTRLNNDMTNLLAGTGIATVFVDSLLNIMRFTPAAASIINLLPSDTGRPVAHLSSNMLDYDDLVADSKDVLATLTPQNREVRTQDGRWFDMRIAPYRTLESVIEGVVITFIDITSTKKAQKTAWINEERMRVALQSSRVCVFNQDESLVYVWAHGPRQGFLPQDVIGKHDTDFLEDAEAATLTRLKQGVLETGKGVHETLRVTVGGRPAQFEVTLEPLRDSENKIVGITGATTRAADPTPAPE